MENVQGDRVNNKYQKHLASECIRTQWLKTPGNAQWLSELLATVQATAYTEHTRALRDQPTTCNGERVFNFTGIEEQDSNKKWSEDEDDSSDTSNEEYDNENITSIAMFKEAKTALGIIQFTIR